METENTEPWNELDEIERYFKEVELPESIRLNEASEITDVPKFIESHIETVRHNEDRKVSLPYLDRLRELKDLLTKNNADRNI
jgi:hypothetical protein